MTRSAESTRGPPSLLSSHSAFCASISSSSLADPLAVFLPLDAGDGVAQDVAVQLSDNCNPKTPLTAFHLQQGFGQDAAGHTDGLADVVAGVLHLDVGDGELAAQRHGEAARLRRLLDGEQQDLGKRNNTAGGGFPLVPQRKVTVRLGAVIWSRGRTTI
ncbi:hypothetical protein EYF80_037044 [Liparis tanakae]|uniref:Uncharacterized protein n=1 Tax=Liparis tanakae TaxID=230148 RepID=A0A4Z2GHE4_9TELE|nr:hypothetical protein EYF80_037044 [Liparis tanakae]